jgi:hypothetical protein
LLDTVQKALGAETYEEAVRLIQRMDSDILTEESNHIADSNDDKNNVEMEEISSNVSCSVQFNLERKIRTT